MTRAICCLSLWLLLCVAAPAQQPQAPAPRTDSLGDPLPEGVLARMGSGRLRHAESITHLAFLPGNKTLLSVTHDGEGRLWDTASGKLVRRFGLLGRGIHTPENVATADGRTLVVATNRARPIIVRWFDVATGKQLKQWQDKKATQSADVCLSPDGRGIAISSREGQIRLIDLDADKELLRFPVATQGSSSLVFRPDVRRLAVIEDDTIRVYDSSSGTIIQELKQQGFRVIDGDFSADGRYLVSSAWGDKEGPLTVWDLATGKAHFTEINGRWLFARFSPDGKRLACSGFKKDLTVIDPGSGKILSAFPIRWARPMAFSDDGRTLAAAHDYGVSLWDVGTGKRLSTSSDPAFDVYSLKFIDGGARLFGSAEAPIIWDAATGETMWSLPHVRWATRGFSVISPDEKLLATKDLNSVHLRALESGIALHTFEPQELSSMALFTHDSRKLVAANNRKITFWDVRTGKPVHEISSDVRAMVLALSPDGQWLAAGSREPEKAVRVWDIATCKEVRRFAQQLDYPDWVAFSSDQRLLAASSWRHNGVNYDRAIQFWEVASGREVRSFTWDTDSISTVGYSPDGRTLVVTRNNGLHVWELATGKERHSFKGHEGAIRNIAFSPSGDRLAAASPEAPVYIWDLWHGLPAAKELSPADLDRCWAELAGDDAKAAFGAIRQLSTAPKDAVPFIRERLRPVAAADAERVKKLLAELDSRIFADRQKAAAQLEKIAEGAIPTLRAAVDKAPLEVRQRIEQILRKLETMSSERLRTIRAVEALEWASDAEATRLLAELAGGADEAPLTVDAAAARDRLRKKAGSDK